MVHSCLAAGTSDAYIKDLAAEAPPASSATMCTCTPSASATACRKHYVYLELNRTDRHGLAATEHWTSAGMTIPCCLCKPRPLTTLTHTLPSVTTQCPSHNESSVWSRLHQSAVRARRLYAPPPASQHCTTARKPGGSHAGSICNRQPACPQALAPAQAHATHDAPVTLATVFSDVSPQERSPAACQASVGVLANNVCSPARLPCLLLTIPASTGFSCIKS